MAALAALVVGIAAFFNDHPFVIGGSLFLLILAFVLWRVLQRGD